MHAGASASGKAQPVCEVSTSARLTCLCAMEAGTSGKPGSRAEKAQRKASQKPEEAAIATPSAMSAGQNTEHAAAQQQREERAAAMAAELEEKRRKDREKRDRRREAAAAQEQGKERARKGVVVQRQAEKVVEFPDEPVKVKMKGAAAKAKRQKKQALGKSVML